MTDFATTIATAPDASAPSVVGVTWTQGVGLDFTSEMKSHTTPTTAAGGSSSSGSRPTVGLVFPH